MPTLKFEIANFRVLILFSLLIFSIKTFASQFVVTNALNTGAGSLRDAITQANGTTAKDTITFAIPGAGPHTITLSTALPTITQPLYIDGSTQAGYVPNTALFPNPLNGSPMIVLDHNGGNFITTINGSDVTVRGLVFIKSISVSSFLRVTNTSNFNVYGCYFGVMADGLTDPTGNQPSGISFTNVNGGNIGSNLPEDRCIFQHLSHTSSTVRSIFLTQGTRNINIRGNYMGISKDGVTGSRNSGGIVVSTDCFNLNIGGPNITEGNLCSANVINGISIGNSRDIIVQNNITGTDYTGTIAKPNNTGIGLYQVCRNIDILDNLCSGNSGTSGQGIEFDGDVDSCTVLRNICGLNKAGTAALPNNMGLSMARGCDYNMVGDGTFANRNIFSANVVHGMQIALPVTLNNEFNIIDFNYCGLSKDGLSAFPNGSSGISLDQSYNNSVLNNYSSGNLHYGIRVSLAKYTIIKGNHTGLNTAGAALPNTRSGIFVSGADSTLIGGPLTTDRNFSAFNLAIMASIIWWHLPRG